MNLERRFRSGLGFGVAYTLSRLRDNGDDKRDILFNAYDDTGTGAVSDNDRTHLFNFHYLYELPFWRNQDTLLKKILGGWQISGVTYFQSGRPLPVWRSDDIAGVGDTTAQPWNLVGDPNVVEPAVLAGPRASTRTSGSTRRPSRGPRTGTFGNAGRNRTVCAARAFQSWDIALFKNIPLGGSKRLQLRARGFNFLNHPNLGNPERRRQHRRQPWRRHRRSRERRLRARAHQDRRAQHPARREVHVLAVAHSARAREPRGRVARAFSFSMDRTR